MERYRLKRRCAMWAVGVLTALSARAALASESAKDSPIGVFLKDARASGEGLELQGAPVAVKKNASGGCLVDFRGEPLVLAADERYARAIYVVGKNCALSLVESTRSADLPARVDSKSFPKKAAAGESTLTASKAQPSAPSNLSTMNSCQIEVWEEDVAGVRMITATDSVSWETEGGRIPSAHARWNAYSNLEWWFLYEKIQGDLYYISEPYSAATYVRQTFNCDKAGPVSGIVCDGPSYWISLKGTLGIDGRGSCSGVGEFTGDAVPFGKVAYEVTRP